MDVDGEEDEEAEQTDQPVNDVQVENEAEDSAQHPAELPEEFEDDPDDPMKSVPLTRYNAMLAIVKNTLFM